MQIRPPSPDSRDEDGMAPGFPIKKPLAIIVYQRKAKEAIEEFLILLSQFFGFGHPKFSYNHFY